MKHLLFISFLFLLAGFSAAQKRSANEWCWAFSHPIAAIKVKKISNRCYHIYKTTNDIRVQLDTFSNGGKLDAFRHIFFMAAFAQKVKPGKLRKLGIAHEKGNYRNFLRSKKEDGEFADSLSTVMDLNNNEIGIAIGRQFKKIPLDSLKEIVIREIRDGKALIMKRRKDGPYVGCDGNIIDFLTYTGKWLVPKCLVSSNYIYTKS